MFMRLDEDPKNQHTAFQAVTDSLATVCLIDFLLLLFYSSVMSYHYASSPSCIPVVYHDGGDAVHEGCARAL